MTIDVVFVFREEMVVFGRFDASGMSLIYSTCAVELCIEAKISPILPECGSLTLLKPAR